MNQHKASNGTSVHLDSKSIARAVLGAIGSVDNG